MLSPAHIEAIKDSFEGKRLAFHPIGSSGTLGIAVENERGYNPVPDYWHHDPNYNTLTEYADKLNTEYLGLTEREASEIVITTMRGK